MIRLAGLPAVGRYPRASVRRDDAAIAIVFSGAAGSRHVEVPLERLGEGEDPEAAELRLSGYLQRMGYRVERLP